RHQGRSQGPQGPAAPAHPRHLAQRSRGGLRRRRRRHCAGHARPDPRPRPPPRDRAGLPRGRGEVARRHPRGGARHVIPRYQVRKNHRVRAYIVSITARRNQVAGSRPSREVRKNHLRVWTSLLYFNA
uniref:Uncharacterized protein n=1 Tax=Triticum urartu TaxID=4572 RepID=A0A8R7PW30_TRIUA